MNLYKIKTTLLPMSSADTSKEADVVQKDDKNQERKDNDELTKRLQKLALERQKVIRAVS